MNYLLVNAINYLNERAYLVNKDYFLKSKVFKNNTFEVTESNQGLVTFKYRDLIVTWYTWFPHCLEVNIDLSPEDVDYLLAECISSLKGSTEKRLRGKKKRKLIYNTATKLKELWEKAKGILKVNLDKDLYANRVSSRKINHYLQILETNRGIWDYKTYMRWEYERVARERNDPEVKVFIKKGRITKVGKLNELYQTPFGKKVLDSLRDKELEDIIVFVVD